MRKFVTKEINETNVLLKEVKIEKGEIVSVDLPSLIIYGKVTDEQIKKTVNKTCKGMNVLVAGKEELTKNYRMPVDMFIELAEEYEPKRQNETLSSQPENVEVTE